MFDQAFRRNDTYVLRVQVGFSDNFYPYMSYECYTTQEVSQKRRGNPIVLTLHFHLSANKAKCNKNDYLYYSRRLGKKTL